VAAQRALSAHDWPGGVAVRVRMGLHSGEPTRHEDGYIGLDVHWAARIAAGLPEQFPPLKSLGPWRRLA